MSIKKKARNKETTIKKIYDTFFKLVLEEGFHKASTNKIAKEAKISIGTLYHHFPNGKKGIIRKYFEDSVETSFEFEEFKKFNMSNMTNIFRGFVSNVLRNHRKNKAYNIAFRSAILSDIKLANSHKERVIQISTTLTMKLQESSDFFKSIDQKRLIRSFILIYNIVNAMVHNHIVFMDLFQKDEDFIDYLSNLLTYTIKYLQEH
ncbi:MAG: TetR/AcrR family transcriptional regulator [Candidatus Lokiarchaeota archaeon]|nr:TetR/AcrR family transcriptional regulator [Candidatus Lokiarchaeota archaeon]